MRLLQCRSTGGDPLLKSVSDDKAIPPYAILSHTWGADGDEVTFNDLRSGAAAHKPGHEKIRFCDAQARKHGLEYFWIDSCCINKEDDMELSKAINSMFRWYRNADRCYVYLSDVSTAKPQVNGDACEWKSAFRKSRWFKRGWTLQELLAPRKVDFFSRQCEFLGDSLLLRKLIHEITNIPEAALQGQFLSQFSFKERWSWIERRKTKLEEDQVYSVLGIFGVDMPTLYGEGKSRAYSRLEDEIEKLEKCTRDLHVTYPRRDKTRIEETKGGLVEESYRWILENPDFLHWRDDSQSRILWIKGDPGKGKTMLLCGIIDEMQNSKDKSSLLCYFFCQATDSRIRSAVAVLRGLLFMLIQQQPLLASHVRKRYNNVGKSLFEDANAWVALTEMFTDVLQDPSLNTTYLIVDALDECVTDLPKLLNFVAEQSSVTSRVKWLFSSRNRPEIEEEPERADHKARLSLELNAESVSAAVLS